MIRYRYRAAWPDGRIEGGLVAAAGPPDVDALLIARGLAPIAVQPAARLSWPGRKVGLRRLALVFRSLATLVEAGVPLERALASSEALVRGTRLERTLSESRRLLREGRTLAEALDASEGVVPRVTIGLLLAGERGSRLGAALEQAAQQLEREADTQARVQQALAYPLVLVAAGSASVILIATVVLPRFATLLADLGQQLPPATRLLLGIAAVTRDYGLLLAAGVIGVIAGLVASRRYPNTRGAGDRLLLRLPLIGALRLRLAAARFCRALGAMLSSGVPILSALAAAREALGDAELAVRVDRSAARIARGEGIAAALGAEAVLPDAALQLVAVGESSGRVGTMALRAGDLASAEAEGRLRTLVSLLEPLLVVGFGGMIAFVAAALLQAVYSLRPA